MKSAVSILVFLLLSTSAFALDEAVPCEKDADCPEDMACFEGECISRTVELKFLGKIQDPRVMLDNDHHNPPKKVAEPATEEIEVQGGGPDIGLLLIIVAIAGIGGFVAYQNKEKLIAYQRRKESG